MVDSVEEIKIESQKESTTDADLVELAGYHAYESYNVAFIDEGIHGKEFYVVDVENRDD